MQKYKKISKNQNFIGKRFRLLLTDDHLMMVSNLYSAEEYRRFFFKDIKSIIVYRTLGGFVANIISGVLLLFFSAFAIILFVLNTSKNNEVFFWMGIFWTVLGIIVLCYLLYSLIKGPTSKTIITTLNSEESIMLSGYFYKTMKIINKIRPLIIKQQGAFTQADLVDRLQSQ